MGKILYLLVTGLNVSSNQAQRADCLRCNCHFYTNICKTKEFAGQSDDSVGDKHNKIAGLMHFHANNN